MIASAVQASYSLHEQFARHHAVVCGGWRDSAFDDYTVVLQLLSDSSSVSA